LVLAIGLGLLGCKSAQEKCDEALAAAETGWQGYVGALERALAQAKAMESDSQAKLVGDVSKRLSPLAQARATERYDPGSAAWLRAQESTWNELCTADSECASLKERSAEAKVAQRDLSERLLPARAALDAVRGPIDAAQRASEAAIVHVEYPQLKAAQALTTEAVERCRDLPQSSAKPK
jgi:hypothetical protein